MQERCTKEQFWKLYEKLPRELKDAIFAEETGDDIHDICERNNILENTGDIVKYVGQVLVGALPLEEFQEVLEKEIKLGKEVAKKVNHEITRFIFYPVKAELEALYKTEIAPTPKAGIPPDQEERPTTTSQSDAYREPIE